MSILMNREGSVEKGKRTGFLKGIIFFILFSLTMISTFAGTAAFADVIIDNGGTGTSYTGTWPVSSGANPYGANSLYGRNRDTYTWNGGSLPAGNYEVLMWWTTASTRGPNIEVKINHNSGTSTTSVNQQTNGGKWNSLGTYYFDSAGSVTLVATSEMQTSTSMYSSCADAVWFRYISENDVIIDNGATGTSSTGTWTVSTAANPYGANSLYAKTVGAAYTWSFAPSNAGDYEIYMWWTTATSRVTSVPVTIQYAGGTSTVNVNQRLNGGQWNLLDQVPFEAGKTYSVTVASTSASLSTCADAVLFRYIPDADANQLPSAYIDSISPNPADPGATVAFSGHGEDSDGTIAAYSWDSSIGGHLSDSASFTTNALSEGSHTISFSVQDNEGEWSSVVTQTFTITGNTKPTAYIDSISPSPADKGATVTFTGHGADSDGTIAAYSWDSSKDGHLSDSASFTTNALSEGSHTISFTVKDDDGVWSSAATRSLTVVANSAPAAFIDVLAPNPGISGAYVFFSGHGTDSDGTIASYRWVSSIDGLLSQAASFNTYSLSLGVHTITFTVYDDDGVSASVTQTLNIIKYVDEPVVEMDNGGAGTSSTGTWTVSTATGAYGSNSVYAKTVGATYSWTVIPSVASDYEVYMWWAAATSRVTSVPVTIQHAGGTSTVYVNQRLNGGQWNLLGQYTFEAGTSYTVTVRSTSTANSTCADAVKFVRVDTNTEVPPTADFSADKTTGGIPLTVQFTDESTENPTGWLWNFGDGSTSTAQNPSHQYTKAGAYTVSLKATNTYGSDTMTSASYITTYSATEHIYCISTYGGFADYAESAGQSLSNYGAKKVNGLWTYTNSSKGITYILHNVSSKEQFNAAVQEEGAVILIRGHSNYGLGLVFPPFDEAVQNISSVDDDRFFILASDTVDVAISGLNYSQAFPYFRPVYKDGTSAIWPYDWNDPEGRTPPYNYYMTYTLPGDPTHYRVEYSSTGGYIARFENAGTPWYRADGSLPDPVDDEEYFIVNSYEYYNHSEFTGDWSIMLPSNKNFGRVQYTFNYKDNGSTGDTATYHFAIKPVENGGLPGNYEIFVTYDPDPANATNVTYTINGTDTVVIDQEQPADTAAATYVSKSLGVFYLGAGDNTVRVSGAANGRVIADQIYAVLASAPVQSEFNASVRTGSAPLAVTFTDLSYFTGTAVEYTWDFGDGTVSYDKNPIHTYASPGVYTVSLTVADEKGEDTETKESLIAVGDAAPLHAEFTATSRRSTTTYFVDQSSGAVTGWLWDFGDGTTSTLQNPNHRYSKAGQFTVTLTVYGPDGSSLHKEENFKYRSANQRTDNEDLYRSHFEDARYGNKTALDARYIKDVVDPSKFKYKMIFFNTCFSGKYYMDSFHHGRMFYTNKNSENGDDLAFIIRYVVNGYSDTQLLNFLNGRHPNLYEFYDFTQKPPSMR
jgi:PKD repeat protein